MIMGGCPYCDKSMWTPIAEGKQLPLWERKITECCKKVVWVYHSRLDPVAYTDEGFRDKYDIDETTKQISEKKGQAK